MKIQEISEILTGLQVVHTITKGSQMDDQIVIAPGYVLSPVDRNGKCHIYPQWQKLRSMFKFAQTQESFLYKSEKDLLATKECPHINMKTKPANILKQLTAQIEYANLWLEVYIKANEVYHEKIKKLDETVQRFKDAGFSVYGGGYNGDRNSHIYNDLIQFDTNYTGWIGNIKLENTKFTAEKILEMFSDKK